MTYHSDDYNRGFVDGYNMAGDEDDTKIKKSVFNNPPMAFMFGIVFSFLAYLVFS
jgi:zona occludens toxin (predicted ATPase)